MATEIKAMTPFNETTEATVLVTDNELLGQYLFKDDASAFEELVRRHSGLVMGVCRNMLFHTHDAEDAFQATFLILSNKGRSLLDHGSIAGWLYQTAMRNCLQIRRRKGRARETEMIEEPIGTNEPWQTISNAQETELIHQEINRLPKRYRDAIVLCHLQGHTRSEAAEFLDWTEAAVKAALARGRNLLRRRLIRSGLMTSVAIGMLSTSTIQAASAISEPLIHSTLQHCGGITPTLSVGNGAHLVQTLSNTGVLSMQTATIIKSFSLAASVALAVCIPLALIAQQTEVGSSTDATDVIVSSLEGENSEGLQGGPTVAIADTAKDKLSGMTAAMSEIKPELEEPKTLAYDDSLGPNTSVEALSKGTGFSSGQDRFSKENSNEYWELMLKSYEAQAKAIEHKTRSSRGLNDGDLFELMAKKFEAEAKAIEASLNLKRIAAESKAPREIPIAKQNPLNSLAPRQPSKPFVYAGNRVQGLVVRVEDDGLIAVSAGADDGVEIGRVVEIFRGNKFVSKAIVVKTETDLSAAKIVEQSSVDEVRQGDRFTITMTRNLNRKEIEKLRILKRACDIYRLQVGQFPDSLSDLFKKPKSLDQAKWGGPYVEIPVGKDAWGNEYGYHPDEKIGVNVFSFGLDGRSGTDDDITSSSNFDFVEFDSIADQGDPNFDPAESLPQQDVVLAQSIPPSAKTPVKPGDVLLVESPSDRTLNRRVVVRADHTISMPLVGTLSVQGQTTREIGLILDDKYSQFVKDPQMFVVRESASTPMKQKQ